MNWHIIEGKWDTLKGTIKSQWAKLTDDDVSMLSAKRDMLVGRIQERYGVLREDAEKQVDEWIARVGREPPKSAKPSATAKGDEKPQH